MNRTTKQFGFHGWILATGISLLFWLLLLSFLASCTKHHPHEPPEQVPPDTVVVHFHHDHIITLPDTVFVSCFKVDITVEFILIADRSQPNIHDVFLNGEYYETITITETFPIPTEVFRQVSFKGIVFGDVITIRKVSGSKAESLGSSIIDIRCSSE